MNSPLLAAKQLSLPSAEVMKNRIDSPRQKGRLDAVIARGKDAKVLLGKSIGAGMDYVEQGVKRAWNSERAKKIRSNLKGMAIAGGQAIEAGVAAYQRARAEQLPAGTPTAKAEQLPAGTSNENLKLNKPLEPEIQKVEKPLTMEEQNEKLKAENEKYKKTVEILRAQMPAVTQQMATIQRMLEDLPSAA